MRRLLIATTLLLVAPLVAAQAYKWKDANGTVHYSDAPPPQGTNFSKVKTSGSVEAPTAPAPESSAQAGESDAKADKPAQAQLPVMDTPENRAKLCANIKSNMEALKSAAPVVMQDGGQQKVMTADQRSQQLTTNQTQYQQYCSGG
ncbi:DUF4124 domain-containing protein [Dyella telluris]|uniref:DUF4124 domain-containing protein n=1 Tax=Dyella telluris TaxID=2763498 RepID=A0A7G8Q758_9GAMM|nr:DUF4124 domain-containing protein [Dyella telluris]QNK02616.1 DUF4124 domain-containing protein [Dyella telluris]